MLVAITLKVIKEQKQLCFNYQVLTMLMGEYDYVANFYHKPDDVNNSTCLSDVNGTCDYNMDPESSSW